MIASRDLDVFLQQLVEKSKYIDSKLDTVQHYFPKSFLKYFEDLEFDIAQENYFNCGSMDQADRFLTTIESNCYHLFYKFNTAPDLKASSLIEVVSTAKRKAAKKEDFLKMYLGLASLILRSPHSLKHCEGLDLKSCFNSLGGGDYEEKKSHPNFKKFCLLTPFCFKLMVQGLIKRSVTVHFFENNQNISKLTEIIRIAGPKSNSLFKQEFILWLSQKTCIVFENPEIPGKNFEIKINY